MTGMATHSVLAPLIAIRRPGSRLPLRVRLRVRVPLRVQASVPQGCP